MSAPGGPAIFTAGHSTRPIDEFLGLLVGHGISTLVDIRTVPRSSHNPQFGAEALAATLAQAGIAYHHEPRLGGRRKPLPDSRNTAWRRADFRGYADHMEGPEFAQGLAAVIALGASERVALMCAEGAPFRCHRSLVADALLARGVANYEIGSRARSRRNQLTPFARVEAGRVTYRGPPAG